MPSSAPIASRSACFPPSGNSSGWASAYATRELSFGPYRSPLPSGTSMRSRGTETMLIDRPTGSIEATIIVSVRLVFRVGLRSTPTSSTLSRSSFPGPVAGGGPQPCCRAARRSGQTCRGTRSRTGRRAHAGSPRTARWRPGPTRPTRPVGPRLPVSRNAWPTARRRQPRSRKLIVRRVASTGGETTKAARRVSDCVDTGGSPGAGRPATGSGTARRAASAG